ncbi:MAG: hypothetical protein WC845_01250 [Candidatus Staskawiczbacteria bacterium]|jgi:multidrug transporter EmrE-like cation transporter
MTWIIPLVFLILFEIIADILAKGWALHGSSIRWIGAISAYIIANSFWLIALRQGSGLGRGAVIFSVVSAILAVAVGLLLYKEGFTRIQFVGIFLGLISLILIFWNN